VSPEDPSSVVVEQNATPVECFAIGELPATVSEASSLLAGAMPFDLTTLRQAANDLFARMESLGEGISAVTEELSLTRCLVVATIAAGGLEFVRRRGKRAEIDGVVQSDSGEGPSWAPLLVLVVLQPEGEP